MKTKITKKQNNRKVLSDSNPNDTGERTVFESVSVVAENPPLLNISTLSVYCVLCTQTFIVARKDKITKKFIPQNICPHVTLVEVKYT